MSKSKKKVAKRICFGDKVVMGSSSIAAKIKGHVKYCGELEGKKGTFYGIELAAKRGNSDGTFKKTEYFVSTAKKALFCKGGDIKSNESDKFASLPRVCMGDEVKVTKVGENGKVKFIGTMTGKDDIFFGIELNCAKGKNNGTVRKRCYFSGKAKSCVFVKGTGIEAVGKGKGKKTGKGKKKSKGNEKKSKDDDKDDDKDNKDKDDDKNNDKDKDKDKDEKKSQHKSQQSNMDKIKERKKTADFELEVGMKVAIKAGRKGQIMWIGEDKLFGVGMFYGIQFPEARGDCDGMWKDKRYFKCDNNCGQYLQRRFVEKILTDEEADFHFDANVNDDGKQESDEAKVLRIRREKIRQLKEKFKEADDDGSLTLERQEFVKMAKETIGLTDIEADQLFDDVDASGNGSVSFAEFDSWLRTGGGIDKLQTYKKLKDAFKSADNDGNLELDLDEFTKLANDSMDLNNDDAKQVFTTIDANKNGQISFIEFEAWIDNLGGLSNMKQYSMLKKAFKDADVDGSGSICLDEFKKLSKDKLGWNIHKATRVFSKIDTSNDGNIQFDEFEKWIDKIGGHAKINNEDDEKDENKEADKDENKEADKEEENADKEEADNEEADKDENDKNNEEDNADDENDGDKADEADKEVDKEEADKEEANKEDDK